MARNMSSRQCWWRSIWRPHCPLPTLHSRERNAQAHIELGRTRGYHDRLVNAPSSSSTEESRRWTLRSSPQPSSLIRVTKSFSNCEYRVHVRHKSPPSRFRPMDGNGTKRNGTERNGTIGRVAHFQEAEFRDDSVGASHGFSGH